MVREAIVSAATLAGLIGLACFYGNQPDSPNRVARAADDIDLEQFDLNDFNDAVFAEDFLDGDVNMFQGAGGAKKQIPQVKNCMKNPKCIERAQESVKKWASSAQSYISANPARLLKPINSGYEEAENDFGFCTPNDDAVACDGASADPLATYKSQENSDPKAQISASADVQALIDSYADSSAMSDALSAISAAGPRDQNNAFRARAAKVFLVIPNGVPVNMPDAYQNKFGNYWRWFKQFNSKYIGIASQGGINRVNMHMWFLRQDKNLKTIMRVPAKTSNKFPWRRFDNIMLPNQNTAAQPKLSGTFQALWDMVDSKGMSADPAQGQDCFTLWFHQYIPADVLDLSDSLFQEETMANLEKACTIIHVWVGAQVLEGDDSTAKVIQYVQGLLQPEQLKTTSSDSQLRRYYFISDLDALMSEEGAALADKIYNDIAIERSRATCLFAEAATDLGAVFEANTERYDEYYSYGEDATTTNSYDLATSAFEAYDVTYDADDAVETSAAAYDALETTAGEPGIPDFKCCGIGFGAKKYDANVEACCEDGSVAGSEADCFLL